jgi:hypothetical protein
VETALRAEPVPVSADQVTKLFLRARTDDITDILDTLVTLSRAHKSPDGQYAA